MARQEIPSNSTSSAKISAVDKVLCGVIMPISATQNHSEQHWRDVQILVHRVVESAGFEPRNVWESTLTDRVSERIVGNIFRMPIVIADISDLNPNVMLELGLRLASKKPTIVIANLGGEIPFDIRDFHAIFYPIDLNILEMEDFFKRVSRALKEKYEAFNSDSYVPFLGSIIVDVASPETREVGANQIIMDRLDDLANQIRHLEQPRKRSPSPSPPKRVSGSIDFTIPSISFEQFKSDVRAFFEVDDIFTREIDEDTIKGVLHYSGATSYVEILGKIESVLALHGGESDVPF